MGIRIKSLLLCLSIGFLQVAHAAGTYSDALVYAMDGTGNVFKRVVCGGAKVLAVTSCDQDWTQVDNDHNVKFMQAGGNILFEVYASGLIWITLDFGASWINAGTDAGVTGPNQLTVSRSQTTLANSFNIYKASNGVVSKWISGSTWQAVSTLTGKGTAVAVSGDFAMLTTPGSGLRTVFRISTGAQVIDRQYGPLVGTVDEFKGSSSVAYLARFVPGTTTNQETVISTYGGNPQYGPAFTFSDLKGLAVADLSIAGPNDVFLLLPRTSTVNNNKVIWVNENTAPFVGNNHPGVSVGSGLASGIAAASSYEASGAGARSLLWVLKPDSSVFEFKCAGGACSFVGQSPAFPAAPTQIVATTLWNP